MSELLRIPVIKLYDNLIVSIQIALSDRLVMQLKDDITNKICDTEAKGLVVDVSGIDVLDSYISRALCDIGMMANLMGVTTVICGLDPMIAMTLVEMGLDLGGVHTAAELESAIELLARIKRRKRLARSRRLTGKGRTRRWTMAANRLSKS